MFHVKHKKGDMHMEDNTYRWPGNNQDQPKKPTMPDLKRLGKSLLAVVLFMILITMAGTCFYTVDDKQQAVVTTFGKVTSIEEPGIHLKIPFGIQQVNFVDVNVLQKIEIGFRSNPGNADTVSVTGESKMISGDYNIVNCDFFVEYKISDPVKYLFNSRDPGEILKSLAQSNIRNVISSYNVDSILTTGKGEIQAKIKEAISSELVDYDLGLVLTDIKLQDSEPPTIEVQEAFKEVETAKQDKDTAINVAQAYKNSEIPLAEAEADKLIRNAEYLKADRINEANMQVAMFNAMYAEYAQNPEITRSRMYYEAIAQILPGVKLYINTGSGSEVDMLLPLESIVSTGGNQG